MWLLILLLLMHAARLPAQTTQSVILGTVTDAISGNAISGAQIEYEASDDGQRGSATSSVSGFYVLPSLSRGTYHVSVRAARYQSQELFELRLEVAASLQLDFHLRLLGDVWEQGLYHSILPQGNRGVLPFVGPDLDPGRSAAVSARTLHNADLEATVSDVVSEDDLRDLPLAGRDAYTFVILQPAVTAGTPIARGLSVAAGGQRPASSSFLLDGVENNNYVATGPLTEVAPEALQEYRISISNFSAEYGRTSGYLTNAVTRAGGNHLHGMIYYYLKNEALNANSFQDNLLGVARQPLKEAQPGFTLSGPIRSNSLFFSSAVEYFRGRSLSPPVTVTLPTASYREFTASDSLARYLLDRYSAPLPDTPQAIADNVTLAPIYSLNRTTTLSRIDKHFAGGSQRIMARVITSNVQRPDFIWSPYPDFITPLQQATAGAMIGAIGALKPNLTYEARASLSLDDLYWNRSHSEIPTLESLDGTLLPGSPAFYSYRNRTRNWELNGDLMWVKGQHLLKLGSGALIRYVSGTLTAGGDGRYLFNSFFDFTVDMPTIFQAMAAKSTLPDLTSPQYARHYQDNQYFGFAEDTWKLSPNLTLNGGVRYDNFGVPHNVGANRDALVQLGSGSNMPQRIASAQLVFPGVGDEALYSAHNNDFALRGGFSWQPKVASNTTFRGAYGIFFDRPFDNLWQNLRSNGIVLATAPVGVPFTNYLTPVAGALNGYRSAAVTESFPEATLYQPGIRDAYVENFFLGMEQHVTDSLTFGANVLGALGRELITTDQINRPNSVAATTANPLGLFNPTLGTMSYRANQGFSDYYAFSTVVRYRTDHARFQATYTWSHSIDNQSDPLAGDFFDLTITGLNPQQSAAPPAAFSYQFDSRSDRSSSDFDQRHNFVLFSSWDVPHLFSSSRAAPLLQNWSIAQILAIRSGFPFSVYATSTGSGTETIYNLRADLVSPAYTISKSTSGGELTLDPSAFAPPSPGRQGTSGRNAFPGPGMYSLDFSLSRAFRPSWLGSARESGRFVVRADAFNLLNHANLNPPDSTLGSPTFGLARYGLLGRGIGFPAQIPLNETPRQIQLMLRIEF